MTTAIGIDGPNLAYTAWYAARDGGPERALRIAEGMIGRLLGERDERTRALVAWDPAWTWRHHRFPAYKAQRAAPPEGFAAFRSALADRIEAAGLPQCTPDDEEADDLLCRLAARRARRSLRTILVSADKDLRQALEFDECVVVSGPSAAIAPWTYARFVEEYGFRPYLLPVYTALVGDVADGLPGVPGIGEKTAKLILSIFAGGVQGIFASRRAAEHKGNGHPEAARLRRAIAVLFEHQEQVRRVEQLATASASPALDRIIDHVAAAPPDYWARRWSDTLTLCGA